MMPIPIFIDQQDKDAIINLQQALLALMPPTRKIIKPLDPEKPLLEELLNFAKQIKLARGNYDKYTYLTVEIFQRQQSLSPARWGNIDAVTARKLNQYLTDLGLFGDPQEPEHPGNPSLRVRGTVRDSFGDVLNDVRVVAFDRDLRREQLLGADPVQDGRYEIKYERAQFQRAEKDSADLVLKVMGADGTELYKTPIHHNVPDDFELNIVLQGAEYKGPNEWEVLTGTLTPLLENVTPAALSETVENQDVSFLAGETNNSRLLIATWIACFRLADKTSREETPLPPEVLFGFLRQGQPSTFSEAMLQDMQIPDRTALLEDNLLRGIADLLPSLQKSLLLKAIDDNVIPARVGPKIPEILDTLARIKLHYAQGTVFGGGKGTIGQVLGLTLPQGQQFQAFMTAFVAHKGPLKEFWKQLEDNRTLPVDTVRQVKLTFELGALTRNHVPLVAALAAQFSSGEVKAKRELARFSRADWVRLFASPGPDGKPIGVPANIDGENNEAKREQFAAIVEQQFQKGYPTTSFGAILARSEDSPLKAKQDVVRFVDGNPAFHLDRLRIDHYVKEHPQALDGIEDKGALMADLKAVQRVFKLNSTYNAVTALLSLKIDSAQQIYFMGPGQFLAAMTASGVNKIEVKKLYRRAESAYAMVLAMYGQYNTALNGLRPFAVPDQTPDAKTQAAIATLPNLEALFGSLDYCECTYCRSVYSPAAYFVDVMRFLGERGTHGSGINAGKNVQQVLLQRRPDLGEIELSCDNTNTPLPYIDLVNEILEDTVAPPAAVTLNGVIEADLLAGAIKPTVLAEFGAKSVPIGQDAQVYAPDSRGQWAVRDARQAYKLFKTGAALQLLPTRQTFLSAAELRANPEYTNNNAYIALKQQVFPLNLPFDLWHLQARTYLAHLGVPQPRLLELFQQTLTGGVIRSPTDLQIDCAWLTLTDNEHAILTDSLPGKQPWDFWGLAQNANSIPNPNKPADTTANITGSWIDVMGSVDVMLHRSGLAYKELLQLLDMRYVNATGSIFIVDTADPNAANCDTSLFTISNLTADALNRIHCFIRLWRKLGCAMWELDILIPDTNPTPNTIDKRITDAVLQDISRMNRLHEELDLDWRTVFSFYNGIDHDLYVDRSKDGAAVQTLYQRLFRNKLVDAVASFPPSPDLIAGSVADRVPGILAALRISEFDLQLILADLGAVTTDPLKDLLHRIWRIAVLAHGVKFSVDQFLRLKQLWAQDPFANPGATRSFVELCKSVVESGFSVLELDYLLAHRYTPKSGVALEDKAIIVVLQALREGLQRITDDVRLKTEEAAEAYVKSKLGLLPALGKDVDQTTAISIIDGTWQGTALERNTLIDALFAGVLDLAVAKVKLAAIPAGLSAPDRQAAVDARFGYVQPELESFLLRTQKEGFVRQKIAEVVQLNVPAASALLGGLHLQGVAHTLLDSINDPHLIDRAADGSYQFALDETSFPAIFEALRLLHKVALMVGKLHMRVDELAWWMDGSHAANMGWMHPKDFPVDTSTQLGIDKWLDIHRFFFWKGALPKAEVTAFEFASHVLDAAQSSTANLAELAQLTAWDADDIQKLASAFGWIDAGAIPPVDVIKQELRKASNLVRLADCMAALRRLGVNAARAVQWAKADPTSAEADGIKQSVKAKYDLAQWLQVIQPIQDGFREHKRQALVGWLVAHPNQANHQNWTDVNGLYSYFLIDVEMGACMLTSRLKQAAASAQLFVQRCLLNLEVDILAKTDLDPRWKQWKWMKRFRVWEANRKVFLYPENWIEPELRDEKSPFFKELENELMQNDITADTAGTAFLNYLEKLDAVANLEIRAIFNEVISAQESVLHVIGRRRSSQTPEYFYRKRINGARWTAWEPVGIDINSNLMVASVFNRRLFLFWPQLIEKSNVPTKVSTPTAGQSDTSIPQPDSFWEVRLFWSELKKGKWTPKVLSDQFAILRRKEVRETDIALRVIHAPYTVVQLFDSGAAADFAPTNHSDFDIVGKQIDKVRARDFVEINSDNTTGNGSRTIRFEESAMWAWRLCVAPNSQVREGLIMNRAPVTYYNYSLKILPSWESITTVRQPGGPFVSRSHFTPSAIDATSSLLLMERGSPNSFTVVDSYDRSFNPEGTDQFFFWDRYRTYFVDYQGYSQTSYSRGFRNSLLISSFRFFTHYHPFVELFIKELNVWGIRGLLNRRIQVDPATIPGSPVLFDFASYQPNTSIVVVPGPEVVDFSYAGGYSPYNWELFFHAPFFIANRLSANQRFEEALEWFHYIFDPTSTDTATPNPDTPQQKFWITKPFYETTKADYYKQKIENIMLAIAKGDAELRAQVEEWRNNPFNPHLIARMRTVAYQKNVLIKYVQTLIAWGDQLFRQATIETVNEATQLYILAASVLGPRPKSVPKAVPNPVKTYYQLQQDVVDEFGNVLKEVENLLPAVPASGGAGEDAAELPHLEVLYFCIPNNEKLLTLWDTVSDRLFKIRHCKNIEGAVLQMPLFEPPIDPALLVKAAAAGLDIGAVLNEINAPLPLYRFNVAIQRALELCGEVRSLGAAMLSALEKRDAEGFALLRSSQELSMLDQVRLVKTRQADEALRTWEGLLESRKVIEERAKYYEHLVRDGLNPWEVTSLALTGGAIVAEIVATVLSGIAAGTSAIPQFTAGAAGFGGSPVVTVSTGGTNVSSGLSNAANVVKSVANILQMGSGMAATIGGHNRRAEDWEFQARLAKTELPQIDKQIVAANIRQAIADQEVKNHDKQTENQKTEDEYMRSGKFTNQELYDWMSGQLATVYFQSYQLAYDVAKRAERSLRYELGLSDTSYIQFGYWDSLKRGLVSGEKLFYDLKRLEAAYYEQNRREYELTKHISLMQVDPIALLMLRQNGECFVDIPEAVFDMDYPGHYFRRLKSVSVSIPCVTGPYTTVACTLTLIGNQLRKDSTLLAGKYERDLAADDPRFRDEIASIQSIATSRAQNDTGMFELNFRDDRYLPFEGAGAISSWHIKLNTTLPQFDLSSLSDVVIHLSYTAREGGALLASKATDAFETKMNALALAEDRRGLYRIFDLKREYSAEWYKFLHPALVTDDQVLVLNDLADRLPYFTQKFAKKARLIEVVAKMKDGQTYEVSLSPLGMTAADLLPLALDPTYLGLHRATKDLTGSEVPLGNWTLGLRLGTATDFQSLPKDAVEELFLIVNYTIAP